MPTKRTKNSNKKNVLPRERFIISHVFLGHTLFKGQQFVFTIWASWVSKDAEFYGEV
jgi:hypothetical protein